MLKTGVVQVVVETDGDKNRWRNRKLSDLELIPHPDTVRIDYIGSLSQDNAQLLLPTEIVQKNLSDVRAAIDMAMAINEKKAA